MWTPSKELFTLIGEEGRVGYWEGFKGSDLEGLDSLLCLLDSKLLLVARYLILNKVKKLHG